ncbi:MAG: flagellar basal body rod protein FlgC [Planctomycetes bacterium]|nr:flagellar basal body rod protein FlgC [Planctomycetota bacterium]
MVFDTLDVSASGLLAQRTRMHVIANNLANVNTTRNADGEIDPFRRRVLFFAQGSEKGSADGVRVHSIEKQPGPLPKIYDPGHPEADADGYRETPNVVPIVEMVDMLEATRAYEGNLTVMETTKAMVLRSLSLLI